MIELTGNTLTIDELVGRCAAAASGVAPLGEEVAGAYGAQPRVGGRADRAARARSSTASTRVLARWPTGRSARRRRSKLSRNVIVVCVCGVGDPLPEDVVRGMMLIRANMLAKGHSGVCPVVARR